MERAASALSRRNLVLGAAGTAIAALLAAPQLLPGAGEQARRLLAGGAGRRSVSLAEAEQEAWSAQVGSLFRAEGGFRMRLAGVRPLASAGERPPQVTRRRGFVAVFDVLDGAAMPGDLIYSVFHGRHGRLPIFLSASGSPGRMLAVFN